MCVLRGTDGRLCSASGPGVRDGGDPHSPAGEDHGRPDPAAQLTCKAHNDGAHWEEEENN